MNEKTEKNPRGAGRKKGVKIGKIKPETVVFYKRVTPDAKIYLEQCYQDYLNKKEVD